MDHINFFLQEVEKSRRQIPRTTSAEEYMKFASTNYMMLHYLCQQHSIDFYPLVSKQEFFTECVKKRKEELLKKDSIGKNEGKNVRKSMTEQEEKREPKIKLVIFDKDGTLVHNNFLFQEYCTKVIETFKENVDDVQKFGEKPYQSLLTELIDNDILHYDFIDKLSTQENFYEYFSTCNGHPNKDGYLFMAESFKDFLISQNLLSN